jgi:lysozyme
MPPNLDMALDLIRREEGLRLEVYDDATGQPIVPGSHVIGHPTIGYGRALDVRGINRYEASMMLSSTVQEVVADLLRRYPWFPQATEARQAVIISMAYQLGMNGLAGFTHMLKWCELGQWDEAAKEMLRSKWATQTPERAQRAAHMMRTG